MGDIIKQEENVYKNYRRFTGKPKKQEYIWCGGKGNCTLCIVNCTLLLGFLQKKPSNKLLSKTMVYITRQRAMSDSSLITTKLDYLIGWCRKYSLYSYPFVTACCGMEYMSVNNAHYDIDRFGTNFPHFSPRQSDVLWIVGTITQKQAPILKRIYGQIANPKWVLCCGACACSGGFYDNYATVPGIDKIIPVDIYIPGCPPRPEAMLDGLLKLQHDIQRTAQKII